MTAPVISRAEWLALKRSKLTLGSSSAAAACGLSQYESTLTLYLRMRGEIPTDDIGHLEHVYFGTVLEPIIVRETCIRRGLRLLTDRDDVERAIESDGSSRVLGWFCDGSREQPLVASSACTWAVATLDGVSIDSNGRIVIIEAKNQDARRIDEWSDGIEAPVAYTIQCLHQMLVVGSAHRVELAALIGGNRFRALSVYRDDAQIGALRKIEADFVRCVSDGIEPPADGSESTRASLRKRHPDDDGTTIILPAESVEIAEELRRICEQRKPVDEQCAEFDERERELCAQLEQLIGSHTFGRIPDGSATYSFKTQKTSAGGTTRKLRLLTK